MYLSLIESDSRVSNERLSEHVAAFRPLFTKIIWQIFIYRLPIVDIQLIAQLLKIVS